MPVLSLQLNTLNVFPCMICYKLNPSATIFSLPVLEPKCMVLASFVAACHGSPRAGEALQRQGIPASPHRYSYSAAFLLFRPQFTRFLAHYSSLEREAAGLYVHYPCRCVYRSSLRLATTLPCLPSFTGGRVTGCVTWEAARHRLRCALFTVPTELVCVFPSNESISVRFWGLPRLSLKTYLS